MYTDVVKCCCIPYSIIYIVDGGEAAGSVQQHAPLPLELRYCGLVWEGEAVSVRGCGAYIKD